MRVPLAQISGSDRQRQMQKQVRTLLSVPSVMCVLYALCALCALCAPRVVRVQGLVTDGCIRPYIASTTPGEPPQPSNLPPAPLGKGGHTLAFVYFLALAPIAEAVRWACRSRRSSYDDAMAAYPDPSSAPDHGSTEGGGGAVQFVTAMRYHALGLSLVHSIYGAGTSNDAAGAPARANDSR